MKITEKYYPEDLLEEIICSASEQYKYKILAHFPEIIKDFEENWEHLRKMLAPKEVEVIELYYKEKMNLEEIGKKLELTRERIRQIKKKGIRKLSHPTRLSILIDGYKYIQEKYNLEKNIQEEILLLKKEYQLLKEQPKKKLKELKFPTYDTRIEELNLSPRCLNGLKRKGIRTLEQLIKLSYNEFVRIKNIGRKSQREIVDKVRELGFKMSFDEEEEEDFDDWVYN